jgi:hypothetical protein
MVGEVVRDPPCCGLGQAGAPRDLSDRQRRIAVCERTQHIGDSGDHGNRGASLSGAHPHILSMHSHKVNAKPGGITSKKTIREGRAPWKQMNIP